MLSEQYWKSEAYPGAGETMREVVLSPTLHAVAIRSDDRICGGVVVPTQGSFGLSLMSKPPGEWQWTGVDRAEVELIRQPSGEVRCDLLPTRRHDVRQPVGDAGAADALGLDLRTWLSVRAIVETGLGAAAAMTYRAAERAVDYPPRVNPQDVARRFAELLDPAAPHWEVVSSQTDSRPRSPSLAAPRGWPLGPSL